MSEELVKFKDVDKVDTSTKVLNSISLVTLLIGFFFLLFYIFLLVFPKSDLRIGVIDDGHVVKRDEPFSYVVEICKLTDLPVTLSLEFFDGGKDVLPIHNVTTHTSVGCTKVHMSGIVADTLPPGNYHLRISAQQRINYLRTIHLTKIVENQYTVLDESVAQ